jgi:hypothetical protein
VRLKFAAMNLKKLARWKTRKRFAPASTAASYILSLINFVACLVTKQDRPFFDRLRPSHMGGSFTQFLPKPPQKSLVKAVTVGIAAKAAFGADVCELRGLATHETGHLLIPANQTVLLKDFGGAACILFDVLHENSPLKICLMILICNFEKLFL